MTHSDHEFTEIARDEIVPLCNELAARNAEWHIHALHPGCRFNPNPSEYCFVIEDTGVGRMWRCFSGSSFTDECHDLVQVLHGSAILDKESRDPEFTPPQLLHSVRNCVATGEKWHHHIMKPGCVFSPNPDCHVVTLERESSFDMEIYTSDQPPNDLQREVELLYFEQNK